MIRILAQYKWNSAIKIDRKELWVRLDFNGPYYDIRMNLENALVVYDCYVLFLQSSEISVWKVEAFWAKKNPLFAFSERSHVSALKRFKIKTYEMLYKSNVKHSETRFFLIPH